MKNILLSNLIIALVSAFSFTAYAEVDVPEYVASDVDMPVDEDGGVALAAFCREMECPVFIDVVQTQRPQKAYVYYNGQLVADYQGNTNGFLASTGVTGNTPPFNQHPGGPIYTKFTSPLYPTGDWNGLGNMPYSIAIAGNFAIHGTPTSNWPKLGQPASHGCIRLHPLNAKILNGLVRQVGLTNTWIRVR